MSKKTMIICMLVIASYAFSRLTNHNDFEYVEPSIQREGNPTKGYDYLIYGDYIRSGIPLNYFFLLFGKEKHNLLGRSGKSSDVPFQFNTVQLANGRTVVSPNCLQCHAKIFGDSLIIGLGNSDLQLLQNKSLPLFVNVSTSLLSSIDKTNYQGIEAILKAFKIVFPKLKIEKNGVNIADHLAVVLASRKNPSTLAWVDTALFDIPQFIPTDVPAWWLLKKKHSMFYTGSGRGDFARFMMVANLLTVSDTLEAKEVDANFNDVYAFIKSLQAPKYPKPIHHEKSLAGKTLFEANCSGCHGTYGEKSTYPNYLIPGEVVGTDSILYKSIGQNRNFLNWFNQSWFSTGKYGARLVETSGYIAPPLDGVWLTAPYLHNGSIPTLEGVLSSKKRPRYWSKLSDPRTYDYEKIGLRYTDATKTNGSNVYDTDIPGYGNYGHNFGDRFTTKEIEQILEYLKTL